MLIDFLGLPKRVCFKLFQDLSHGFPPREKSGSIVPEHEAPTACTRELSYFAATSFEGLLPERDYYAPGPCNCYDGAFDVGFCG